MRYSSFLIGASLLATQCSAYQTQSPLSDESETSSGETAKNPFNEEFQKLAEKQLDYWKVPGMAVGIVHGDHEWSAVSLFFVHALMLFWIESASAILSKGLNSMSSLFSEKEE